MRSLLVATAGALSVGAVLAAAAPAATPLDLGLHNADEQSYFYERPGVAFLGTLFARG